MTHSSTVADTLDAGDGWIEWTGGECPISNHAQEVTVRFRNGIAHTDDDAWEWDWEHHASGEHGHRWDIVAYQLVQP